MAQHGRQPSGALRVHNAKPRQPGSEGWQHRSSQQARQAHGGVVRGERHEQHASLLVSTLPATLQEPAHLASGTLPNAIAGAAASAALAPPSSAPIDLLTSSCLRGAAGWPSGSGCWPGTAGVDVTLSSLQPCLALLLPRPLSAAASLGSSVSTLCACSSRPRCASEPALGCSAAADAACDARSPGLPLTTPPSLLCTSGCSSSLSRAACAASSTPLALEPRLRRVGHCAAAAQRQHA